LDDHERLQFKYRHKYKNDNRIGNRIKEVLPKEKDDLLDKLKLFQHKDISNVLIDLEKILDLIFN
jgi:hypothetical protein